MGVVAAARGELAAVESAEVEYLDARRSWEAKLGRKLLAAEKAALTGVLMKSERPSPGSTAAEAVEATENGQNGDSNGSNCSGASDLSAALSNTKKCGGCNYDSNESERDSETEAAGKRPKQQAEKSAAEAESQARS